MTATDAEHWAADLQTGTLGPGDALDNIAAAKQAETTTEAALMREAMRTQKTADSGSSSTHSILGTVHPSNRSGSIAGFTSGFHSGQSKGQDYRSASPSPGRRTGYGSSGGSFAGSGSSSRF